MCRWHSASPPRPPACCCSSSTFGARGRCLACCIFGPASSRWARPIITSAAMAARPTTCATSRPGRRGARHHRRAAGRRAGQGPRCAAQLSAQERTRFALRVTAVLDPANRTWHDASGTVRVTAVGRVANASAGDAVEIVGLLSVPDPPSNPGEFDYASYLSDRGISAILTSRDAGSVIVRDRGHGWSPTAWLAMVRGWGQDVLTRALPASQGDLAAAAPGRQPQHDHRRLGPLSAHRRHPRAGDLRAASRRAGELPLGRSTPDADSAAARRRDRDAGVALLRAGGRRQAARHAVGMDGCGVQRRRAAAAPREPGQYVRAGLVACRADESRRRVQCRLPTLVPRRRRARLGRARHLRDVAFAAAQPVRQPRSVGAGDR